MTKYNTTGLLKELQTKLSDDNLQIELLNTKDDLSKFGIKGAKVYIQYVGMDSKDYRRGRAKFVFYVVDKAIMNNKGAISDKLDLLRANIYSLDDNFTNCHLVGSQEDIKIIEEKYNNTQTLEFIYSLVLSLEVMV